MNIDVNSSVWDGLFVQIQDLGYTKDIIIGNIYRPLYDNNNKENISTFISELDPILSSINATRKDIIITGDFNINLLHINVCNKEHYGDFLDLMLDYSLIPKITLPTRMAENSCSLIDDIFCTISPNNISSQAGIIYSKISDHHPYFLSICPNSKEPPNNKRKYVKQRLNTREAYGRLKQELVDNDVTNMMDNDPYCNPNYNYDILHNHLIKLKNKHLPYRMVKFDKYKHKGNKWITHGILRSIKHRDELYKELSCTFRTSDIYLVLKNKLNTFNKMLSKTIREAKMSYYKHEFDNNRSNVRKTWNTINEILCKTKQKQHGLKSIISNGKKINDPIEIVNQFNDFFINVGPNLIKNVAQPINETYRKYLNKSILTSFHFTLIDENHEAKVLSSLQTKNSSGHDGISMKLLKFLSPALLKPLTIVINQSLLTGIFPDKLKIAKVVPLHKKDDPSLTDNYRPISLLPSISKLFEKIVFIQLTEYLKQNKLLFEGQYGLRENHSTELATIEVMDRVISALDEKKLPLTIYMDLSKAFDTLDHNIL